MFYRGFDAGALSVLHLFGFPECTWIPWWDWRKGFTDWLLALKELEVIYPFDLHKISISL